MSDTETRMMRYTIEQLSAELQAKNQYITDIESKLERTRKELGVAVDGLLAVWRATDHTTKQGSIAYNVLCNLNIKPLDRIKALEQKDVK